MSASGPRKVIPRRISLMRGTACAHSFTREQREPTIIYLYLAPAEAHTVPRRAFASPQAAEGFLQTARAWHAAAIH
jgi:hypothetical protein